MRPKALLVDFDGVIRRWPPLDRIVEERFGLVAGSLHKAAFSPPLLFPAITGEVSDADWRHQVAAHLAGTLGHERASAAVAAWSEHPGEVDPDTLALLDRCHPSLQVVLVSNATSRLPQDLAALGLADRFASVVNSSEVGAAKPDARIFTVALQRAQATPREALFVDDSVANVAAASALGITSHQFVGHAELESFLQQHGALARR